MKSRKAPGFTLAETLAVLGIAGALALLALPLFNLVQKTRDDMTCASNLRQIGLGILAYANDHNGNLPGPLLMGQCSYWEDPTALAARLKDYLRVIPNRRKTGGDVFHCPANRRMVTSPEETPVFLLNSEVPVRGQPGTQVPFGYPGTYYAGYRGPEDLPPMNLLALQEIVDEEGRAATATTWAVKDIDQLEPIFLREKSSYFKRLPKTLVHGNHRNAIFFDFHAGRIDQNNQPL